MEDNNVQYDLTGKKIIPLNAPIGFANTASPTTLPFQPVEKGQSVAEGLCAGQGIPYYNADGTINVNAVATNLKMILDMYNTISQPVALLSMGSIPEWSQSVIDNNGGYNKGATIREVGLYESYDYYISPSNNNINPKPTTNSHEGWAKILNLLLGSPYTEFTFEEATFFISFKHTDYTYEIEINESGTIDLIIIDKTTGKRFVQSSNGNGNILKQNNNLLASYLNTGAKAPMFQDIYMNDKLGYLNSSINQLNHINTITLTNGLVMLFGITGVGDGSNTVSLGAAGFNLSYCTPPQITGIFQPAGQTPLSVYIDRNTHQDFDYTLGFTFNVVGGTNACVAWFCIGKYAGYIGDILGKIRAYKVTPYYKQLSEQQKKELDQYYIDLDREKDATKITTPEWWEKEIEGKDLA